MYYMLFANVIKCRIWVKVKLTSRPTSISSLDWGLLCADKKIFEGRLFCVYGFHIVHF